MSTARGRLNPATVAALLLALAGSGCGLSAATILPTAAGGAPVVVGGESADQPDSFWIARYDDVLAAAYRAAETLSLALKEEEVEDGKAELVFVDDFDKQVRLRIGRRSDTVTRLQANSDLAGMASLLGRQIVDELQKVDAFVVDWSEGEEKKPEE